MKLIRHIYICPDTFKAYGPICLFFHWDILDNRIWEWMEETYPNDGRLRIQIRGDRMIRIQPTYAYFESHDDAMLFKLTWNGT